LGLVHVGPGARSLEGLGVVLFGSLCA